MTRQEFIESLQGTKVYVNGRSAEIQTRLFALGFKWSSTDKEIKYTDRPFLFLEDSEVAHSDDMNYFSSYESKEITAEYILDTEFEEETPEFTPFQKVLVRDGDEEEWGCSFFSHMTDNEAYPFVCVGTCWRKCIPFEGNGHLVGTTANPSNK